jgi:glycosyltransferase involved in cell wall biosynthesis
MVGTLRPEKAYDVLIRAAAALRQRFPAVRVLIVGGADRRGPEIRPGLEALIESLGLGDTVTLLGRRSDAIDLIAAFDVAVLCSDREGSPISVLEYMQAARPVVATRVGGIPDQVIDGETGFLVPAQDPDALARRVGDLLADPVRARAMGEAGRNRRAAEFSMDAMTRRVESMYDELYAAAARG